MHAGRVYAVGENALSTRGMYLAAVMACGPRAALSHRSAAGLWEIRQSSGRIEVTVPEVSRRVAGIRTYRTRMLHPQDFTVVDGIPVTSVARTLLDLAAVLRPPDLEAALDRAERLRIFDLSAVVEVLTAPKAGRVRGH